MATGQAMEVAPRHSACGEIAGSVAEGVRVLLPEFDLDVVPSRSPLRVAPDAQAQATAARPLYPVHQLAVVERLVRAKVPARLPGEPRVVVPNLVVAETAGVLDA